MDEVGMSEGQIRDLVSQLVTDKMKAVMHKEASEDEEIEGPDYILRHVKLLSRKIKTMKRVV